VKPSREVKRKRSNGAKWNEMGQDEWGRKNL
jgi:hypothetical protein